MTTHAARCICLLGVTLLLTATAGASVDEPKVPHTSAYNAAREQLTDLIASEEFTKVEVAAASFNRALDMIYTVVETYLDTAVPELGDVQTAKEYGVEILRGLNEHKIRYAGDGGFTLLGDQHLLVSNETEAQELGQLLGMVAVMIHDARVGRGVNIQSAARRIFEGMLPTQDAGQSLVTQYIARLQTMTSAEKRELMEYAVE